MTSGSGCLGTAAILSGSNSGSLATIGMTWRPRATNEIPGSGATRPPVPATAIGLISDVVQPTTTATGLVILDMTYDSAYLGSGSAAAEAAFNDGALYMGMYSGSGSWAMTGTGSGTWNNTADSAPTSLAGLGVGSWARTPPMSGWLSTTAP